MDIQFSEPAAGMLNEIKKVEPHQRQEDLLSLPDDVFEALYGGAAYGGKSFILTLLPLIRGFYKCRGFKGILFRRNYNDLEKEVIRLSHEYFPATDGVYNETKHSWKWPAYGSYFDFGHINHLADLKRQYDTAQYNYAAFDELTHFEEAMYLYIVGSRVRPGGDFHISFARAGSNPGGVGQTFVFNRFVKPNENGYQLIKDKKSGLYRIFIPAFLQDNPYGMQYDPLYAQKLELLPDNEKRAKKYGDWHAFEGSVFPEFRPIRFPGEPDNALHVVEPFTIPEWWPRIVSIDWGKRAMCHAMWAAISPAKRVFVYRERTWHGRDIPYWASEIRELSFKENIINATICGSAWQDRGVETVAEQFQRYSGLSPSSSDNTPGSRVAGLQLCHDFLRWEQKNLHRTSEEFYDLEKANWISRNFGDDALARYRSQFLDEEPEKNLPKIQFFSTCTVIIETIPVAVYDDKKKEDYAEFEGDDPIDNFRYLCKAANRYLTGDESELIKMRTVQAAVERLNQTQDQTAFYRHMEQIESQQQYGVRRKGRRRYGFH
jgi:hypothetical protein